MEKPPVKAVWANLRLERFGPQPTIMELPGLLRNHGAFDSPIETFWVICFDAATNLSQVVEIARGNHYQVTVSIPALLSAVLVSGGTRFWVIHNHPAGDMRPTEMDLGLTEKIRLSAALVGLDLEDHIIIGPREEWYSMVEEGQLQPSPEIEEMIASSKAGQIVCSTRRR